MLNNQNSQGIQQEMLSISPNQSLQCKLSYCKNLLALWDLILALFFISLTIKVFYFVILYFYIKISHHTKYTLLGLGYLFHFSKCSIPNAQKFETFLVYHYSHNLENSAILSFIAHFLCSFNYFDLNAILVCFTLPYYHLSNGRLFTMDACTRKNNY